MVVSHSNIIKTYFTKNQFKLRFNACRYPEKPSDTAKKFDPTKNNHIVFVRKNKFYEVAVVENGQVLSTAELEAYASCGISEISSYSLQ